MLRDHSPGFVLLIGIGETYGVLGTEAGVGYMRDKHRTYCTIALGPQETFLYILLWVRNMAQRLQWYILPEAFPSLILDTVWSSSPFSHNCGPRELC